MEQSNPAPNAPATSHRSRQVVFLCLAAICVIAIGLAARYWWQARAANEASLPAVKLASIHVTNLLKLRDAETATFKDYFDKADAAVSEIDKASIALRSTADTSQAAVAQAIAYMDSAQEVARASRMLMRKRMELRSAMKAVDDIRELPTDSYMADYRLQRIEKIGRDLKQARQELLAAARDENKALVAFRAKDDAVVQQYGSQVGVDRKAFQSNFDEVQRELKATPD